MGYSLFILEDFKKVDNVIGQPLLFIEAFNNLDEAKIAQAEYKQKTLILQSF